MGKIFLGDLISQLSVALDAVEADLLGATRFHSKRVALLCLDMGRYLGYSGERLFSLAGCALLHDNALTEYILSEYSKNMEREINLRTHCILGEQNGAFFPFPSHAKNFILYHHECADGSGAFGKKAQEYPEEAGLIALADQIDVRFSLGHAALLTLPAIKESIQKDSGKKYLKNAAEAALAVLDEDFLKRVLDDAVFASLQKGLPEIGHALSNREIIDLSRIAAKIIDYKSRFTCEHSTQIANKAWLMGSFYGYPEKLCSNVFLAASFHDIGKLFIPSSILEKPGSLTEEEFKTIKSHAFHTYHILHPIRGFEDITGWASNHHEKLDGGGYPFGKSGKELDFNSRLLACLDIYQAVREERPYHALRSHEDTMKILYGMADKGFIDYGISKDVDEAMAGLRDGFAPFPETLKHV